MVEATAEAASVVALLREGRRIGSSFTRELACRSANELLEQELGLLAAQAHERAMEEILGWRGRGIEVLVPADPRYPASLRLLGDRPPLIFLRGQLPPPGQPAVAVVGTRQPTAQGLAIAGAVASRLVKEGVAVVSGLAAGIDTAAHRAALTGAGATVAVIGTGVDRCYPASNAALQQRIALQGAVLSQFWPDQPPTKRSFPMRNALMAGLTEATVIVEASEHSGTRIQARMSLAYGRRVLLFSALLGYGWARELAARPGVEVVSTPEEVAQALAPASVKVA